MAAGEGVGGGAEARNGGREEGRTLRPIARSHFAAWSVPGGAGAQPLSADMGPSLREPVAGELKRAFSLKK